jgi:hypothetical protein
MKIEGIPDGWELVRIGKIEHEEFFIDGYGDLVQYDKGRGSRFNKNYVIIRKIEKPKKPKQYRAFENPAEAEALLGQTLRLKVNHKNKFVLIGITTYGFQIGLSHWKPKEAFDCLERLDGTPFGIEVTE